MRAPSALTRGPSSPLAAYVHLPFCRRRCYYCDFPIQVVGDRAGAADAAAERYVALLRREISATPAAPSPPLRSLYFGGGTPSLTPPRLVEELVGCVRERYGLAEGAELTLEMDKGSPLEIPQRELRELRRVVADSQDSAALAEPEALDDAREMPSPCSVS